MTRPLALGALSLLLAACVSPPPVPQPPVPPSSGAPSSPSSPSSQPPPPSPSSEQSQGETAKTPPSPSSGMPSKPSSGSQQPPGQQPQQADTGAGEDILSEAMDVFREAQAQREQADAGDGEAGKAGDSSAEQDDAWMEGQGEGDDAWPTEGAPASSQTAEDLEQQFEEAMQDFDGDMKAEREMILARANETAGDRELPPEAGGPDTDDGAQGSPGGGMPGGDGDGGPPPAGDPDGGDVAGAPPPGSGGGRMPDLPSGQDAPPVPASARATVPADIPDGTDDDVVARQLREAAMREVDPQLRQRLWDEYRKYKEATGS